MARTRLTTVDLADAASSSEKIRAQPFIVAASLADEYGRVGDAPSFRNLLLTALEHREAFGEASQIIDGLIREVGLFPYLDPASLGIKDLFAYELHKPEDFPTANVVFHGPQARVYWELMRGRNVVLSAPTSFGKSLIIDAIVGSQKYKNILIVVPTIALIDETRRRLFSYNTGYKIIAHPSQKPSARNIYILTQERVLDLESLSDIEFFVIDEFYKLSPSRDDNTRSALLNVVFHRLATAGKQFYLLGPDIEGISPQIEARIQLTFIHEPYQTVASVTHNLTVPKGGDLAALARLCRTLKGQTLVFCSSPGRAIKIANELFSGSQASGSQLLDMAVDWISENFHPDWHFAKALGSRIGIHHGRIPRALAHFVVRLFNSSQLELLVCTSTLIEGVNTKARNIVVFDNKINRAPIDFFTFNNICGRSGRMFQHFVGHVYLFHSAPQRQLPFVDIPAFSQSDNATTGLLLQLEPSELTPHSRDRLSAFADNGLLPIELLRQHPEADPQKLLILARELADNADVLSRSMQWTFDPSYEELLVACDLIWRHFNGAGLGSGSAFSHSQLATKILKLKSVPSTREQILAELSWSADITVDDAVQRVLDFNKLWASFHFPRLLMTLQAVAHVVFVQRGLRLGDFSAFAARVESSFVSPLVAPLDEYGIPIELTKKLLHLIDGHDLDSALDQLARIHPAKLSHLHPFEKLLLSDAVASFSGNADRARPAATE